VSVKIVKKLSLWFQKSARILPWRQNADPYRVWLSEVMLQQTQVATVIPYFEKFLKEFPEITDLAAAPLEEVFKLWAGLGYYSRARNLHRGAQAIAERLRKGQGFPGNREEWLEVPGVGEYTAGAICSIALHQREPIVDGNVVRVLSRIYSIAKMDAKKSEIWAHSRALVQIKAAEPAVFNQALMELGATLCKPRNPDCPRCPVRLECSGKHNPLLYPPKAPKKEWKRVKEDRIVMLRGGTKGVEVLLKLNEAGGWREGLWDFPVDPKGGPERSTFVSEFSLNYVVTHHRVVRTHRVFRVSPKVPHRNQAARWFLLEDLPGVPAPVKKALLKIQALEKLKDAR